MDTAAFLPCFSATAELLVINLVTHHDPKSDSEFSSCGDSRFSRYLLHQFAPMKTFQRRMALDCVHRRFAPQISQQCVPLFAHRTQPLPASTGMFARHTPMPIYFAWFTKALLSVGGDANDQNLPQSGRLFILRG